MTSEQIYSSLKPFAFSELLGQIRNGIVPPPVHVRIKPTNVCNHSCYFCAYRSDNLTLGSDMVVRDRIPREKMQEIVEDVIAMGVKAVTFSGGGEPLIYPYIAETIIGLAKAGIAIGMLSNGSRLLGKPAEAMAEYGTWLRVSIDGWDGPSYAKYRSIGEDEFGKVIHNLEAFSARGSQCMLGASLIVDHTNASHIAELCKTLKGAGVRHVKISPCIIKDSGEENNRYHEGFRKTVEAQIMQASELHDENFSVVNHYHTLSEHFDECLQTCPMAYMLTIIGADCQIYTCQDKAYTPSGLLGSIKERRFKDFWFSAENAIALAAINPSLHCRHHCVARHKNKLISDFIKLNQKHMPFV